LKKKIFSVLFALVLVLSLGLVTAVPVGAQETLNVIPFTVNNDDEAIPGAATWVIPVKHSGASSVKLKNSEITDAAVFAKVYFGVEIALGDIILATTSFWAYSTDGDYIPYFIFEIPGTYDGGGVMVRISNDAALSTGFTADWAEFFASTITDSNWQLDIVNADYDSVVGYPQWKTWADLVTSYGSDIVNGVVVELSAITGATGLHTVYVDDVTISGTIYDLEGTAADYTTIQSAVDAALPGDTITVVAGIYNTGSSESFPIDVNVADLTIQSVSAAASTTIDSGTAGRVMAISAAGVTIGGTGKGFTIEGEGAMADGLIYLGASATITANRLVGDYYLMVLAPGVSGVTVDDDTFLAYYNPTAADEVLGVYVNNDVTGSTFDGNSFPLGVGTATQHVDSGIYMATGTTADQNITIKNNTFEGMGLRESGTKGVAAIELAGVGGITIEENTITNSNDGIWSEGGALTGAITIERNTITDNVWGIEFSPGTTGSIAVTYNNLEGNTYGLVNDESGLTVDARNNWWGNASGPADAVKLGATGYTAYGDSVSASVDYEPWLLAVVVTGVPSTTFDKTLALKAGWTLISVDKAVASSAWVGMTLAFKYIPTGGFVPATLADLEPLTAIYVKTVGGGGVGINYAEDEDPAFYSKALEAGWNLISIPSTVASTDDILSPLRYVMIGTQQVVGLTTLVSQGEYNQFSESFYDATLTEADWVDLETLIPFDGYWANMEAADTFAVIPD